MGIEKKDPANFTPNVTIPTKADNFRFWCQKVLPLAYDDSLSYYELLCKVVNYLNNIMSDMNTLSLDVDNINKAYNQLQNYVNDYFSTLNVETEINNKLDLMAQNGTLSALIKPLFDKYKTEIDSEVDMQNSKINVLENRMNTFTSLPSGSTSGDAELTDIRVPANTFNNNKPYSNAGDAVRGQVNSLNNNINDMSNNTISNIMKIINVNDYGESLGWKDGFFIDYGVEKENSEWCTLNGYIQLKENVPLIVDLRGLDNYLGYCSFFDSQHTLSGGNNYRVKNGIAKIVGTKTLKYCKLSVEVKFKDKIKIYYMSSKEVTVGEKKDFTKLTDAIKYAYENGNTTVRIFRGTYDITKELTIEDFATSGPILGNGMKLIFDTDAKVVCKFASINSGFSPFNTIGGTGDFEIDGLNVETKNARYCVHDEMGAIYVPYRHIYKNCRMKSDNSESTSKWKATQCIGGGLGVWGNIEIENCIFETVDTVNPQVLVSYHNGDSGSKLEKNKVTIKDSYLIGEKSTMEFGCLGASQYETSVIVTNCSMAIKPKIKMENSSAKVENMKLYSWNNDIRTS